MNDISANTGTQYGGFWIRVIAYFIDSIIMGILAAAILVPLVMIVFGSSEQLLELDTMQMGMQGFELGANLFLVIIYWLYSAGMQSSSKQATLGKMAVGLKVVDLNGNRITFLRSTGRYFATFLSTLIFMIGYIMVAFTDRKQGLHDKLAGTLVIKA